MAKVLMVKYLGEGRTEEIPVRISKMKVGQMKKALKKIQEIINIVQNDESSSEIINYFMAMDNKNSVLDLDLEKETFEETDFLEDKVFLENMMGAFQLLFNKIPDEITELITVISGVDEKLLDEQDYDVLFDVIEAIISENDIKSLIDRAKNSFFIAKRKWGGLRRAK
jgi:ferritin-like protein